MFEEIPWVLISLISIFVLLIAGSVILLKKTGNSLFKAIHKKVFLTQFTIGLDCSLFGAFLMFNGDLFGDNTTGIARILGIIGISLVATASPIGIAAKKRM